MQIRPTLYGIHIKQNIFKKTLYQKNDNTWRITNIERKKINMKRRCSVIPKSIQVDKITQKALETKNLHN